MDEATGANHANAVSLALEDDRLWFNQHSGRDYRLREILSHEYKLNAPPQGTAWKVLVAQISHEIRVRTPIALPVNFPVDDADDGHLGKMFREFAPENVPKIEQPTKRRKTKSI